MKRRVFLQNIALASASSLLAHDLFAKGGIKKFGIQLWTLKEDMVKDPKATLRAVAAAGYKQIETFTGPKGIFWGMTAQDFKLFVEDLGMKVVSSHVNPAFTQNPVNNADFQKTLYDAASIGMKYLINPFPGEFSTSDQWKKTAEGLNIQGEMCKKVGIIVAYHNHHFEFLPIENGFIPEQYLIEHTDPALVKFELDLYWIVKAGQNPVEWFTKYKNRFELVHIKDLHKAARLDEIIAKEPTAPGVFWPAGASTYLGNGSLDFPTILKAAKQNGVKYFIAEQERFDDSTPLQDIVKDAEYLKKFTFA
ncbi:MAG: sugar phosphate isomerase/epimerase family protein [Leadbetterella sp.]